MKKTKLENSEKERRGCLQ